MKTGKGVEAPEDLAAALAGDAEALRVFERMRPSCQREYVQWVTDAKTDPARTRRLAGALTRIRDYGARHGLLDAEPASPRSS
jgi:uncharacterized protein YdeI (YjbR/CyaY-like superfamily)